MSEKLFCLLGLHKLKLISYGPKHFASARCSHCQKTVTVNLWGVRP